ncbi:hypothetical protein EVAR_63955_1 [Eumeta japonica]|uniref:Uncharacterized protein n=1 Tax=Eumeta variegata TaxID=151549 RepID=A0A4C2A0I9_EUMVA|nr:hypothetical protein EVAR_63955_1 [Eumeta japonica]
MATLSEDLVKSIVSIFKIQETITKVSANAVYEFQHVRNGTYFDVPKIFDSVSKSISRNLIKFTGTTPDSKLHRVIFGMARVAAEISIIAVLKETSYAMVLDKIGATDWSLRKRRSYSENTEERMFFNNDEVNESDLISMVPNDASGQAGKNITHIDLQRRNEKSEFLYRNETDMPNYKKLIEDILRARLDSDPYSINNPETIVPSIIDNEKYHDVKNESRKKMHEESNKNLPDDKKLETTAKNAILYSGDIAHLAAETLIALRRVLVASIAVNISLGTEKTRPINLQEHLTSVIRSAAHEASKEARKAAKAANACVRTAKQAIKFTANAHDANLGPLANTILMNTLPLTSLSKSLSYVASDIAMDSLYSATDGLFRRKFVINIVEA